MPIYEYSCRACSHQFEALVRGTTAPVCPECHSLDLQREFSLPTVRSESTKQQMLRDSKKRDARQAAEREYTQRQYEKNHD